MRRFTLHFWKILRQLQRTHIQNHKFYRWSTRSFSQLISMFHWPRSWGFWNDFRNLAVSTIKHSYSHNISWNWASLILKWASSAPRYKQSLLFTPLRSTLATTLRLILTFWVWFTIWKWNLAMTRSKDALNALINLLFWYKSRNFSQLLKSIGLRNLEKLRKLSQQLLKRINELL